MASVIGMTADRVDQITNLLVASGSIDGSGNLVLTTRDGTPINSGNVLQAIDSDLAAIGNLTPADNDFIQRKSGLWVNRTTAQVLADLSAAGPVGPAWIGPTSFTPAITGGGTATWTGVDGWYYTAGDLVFFTAFMVLNAVGNGATPLSLTGPPFNIYRGISRQYITGHLEGGGASAGVIQAVALTGGSVNVWDRIRTSASNSMTGASLTPTGALFLFEGIYRKV